MDIPNEILLLLLKNEKRESVMPNFNPKLYSGIWYRLEASF